MTIGRPGWLQLPGLAVLRSYQPAWLPRDIVAGLVLTAVLVPVGMGYAEAAGLPAITGLYATIVPLLVYAALGPSRILVLGPDSSLAAIIAATVIPLAAGDQGRAVALAGGLALISGALGVAFGILRLGLLTDLLSKPIRIGYLNGIALTVVVSQLPKLFGFSTDAGGVVPETMAFLSGVAGGATNVASLGLGATALAIVVVAKLRHQTAVGIVVATAATTVVAAVAGLSASAGVDVVGPLPSGLPQLALPALGVDDVAAMLAGGLAIAVVSLADTSVLSRTFAARSGQRVDQDQELIALGAANIGAAFTSGFPVSASTSRTPVAESAGGKTQVIGIVGALAITAMLLVAPGLTTDLPQATLAAIVIVAATSLVDLGGLARLIRLRPTEAWLSLVCFVGVVLVGVVAGIFASVGIALAAFFWRAWRPHSAILGRVEGVKGYHDVSRYPDAQRIEGLVLFRWDAPLFFANAEAFREAVEVAVDAAPTPTSWVVVAAEPITDVDMTAADILDELLADLDRAEIQLRFAELKDPVKDWLRRYGFLQKLGEEAFFPTVGTAVAAYVAASGIDWVDWEERGPEASGPSGGTSSST
ncbi:MAG TPA: sulfate permease [Candidatus Limnocylindrales bacterium]|nr:sulfate permease [Candidatus Limnocylindrales bacterium]